MPTARRPAGVPSPLPGGPVPPDVAALLRAYVPELASHEHAPLIRELTAAVSPQDKAAASKTAALLSGFVYWCEQTGQPVTRETLLDLDLIEQYSQVGLAHLAPSTRDQARAGLRRVVRAETGRLYGDHRQRFARDKPEPLRPYTPQETDGLLSWAAARTTPVRRHATLAVAALGLGAGLDAADLATVRGTSITRHPDGTVLVDIRSDRPRSAVVLRRYETLAAGIARDAGPGWIVNPGVEPAGQDPSRVLAKQLPATRHAPTTGPALTLARARATWICHHLALGTPLNVLTDATGLAAIALARYAVHLDPVPPDTGRGLLRQGPPASRT